MPKNKNKGRHDDEARPRPPGGNTPADAERLRRKLTEDVVHGERDPTTPNPPVNPNTND